MRIRAKHYDTMKKAIDTVRSFYPEITEKHYLDNGYTSERWRWDLFNQAANNYLLPEGFVVETLYSYCNDNHIDTALRKITKSKK